MATNEAGRAFGGGPSSLRPTFFQAPHGAPSMCFLNLHFLQLSLFACIPAEFRYAARFPATVGKKKAGGATAIRAGRQRSA